MTLPLQKVPTRDLVTKAVAGARRRNKREKRKGPDGRTWIMKRATMLARMYAERVGEAAGTDPLIAGMIRKAAEVQALADELRQRALRGDESVSPDDIVRTSRLADQLVRRLFEKAMAPPPPDPLSLDALNGERAP